MVIASLVSGSARMALSTAPTGEVVEVLEVGEVSELFLGATASLHHGAGEPGDDCRG